MEAEGHVKSIADVHGFSVRDQSPHAACMHGDVRVSGDRNFSRLQQVSLARCLPRLLHELLEQVVIVLVDRTLEDSGVKQLGSCMLPAYKDVIYQFVR